MDGHQLLFLSRSTAFITCAIHLLMNTGAYDTVAIVLFRLTIWYVHTSQPSELSDMTSTEYHRRSACNTTNRRQGYLGTIEIASNVSCALPCLFSMQGPGSSTIIIVAFGATRPAAVHEYTTFGRLQSKSIVPRSATATTNEAGQVAHHSCCCYSR